MNNNKPGYELIKEERQRQIEQEGWSLEHDDNHIMGQLVNAAVAYAFHGMPSRVSNWLREGLGCNRR